MGGNTSESTTSDMEADLVLLPPRLDHLLLAPPQLKVSPCAATVEIKRSPLSRKAFKAVGDIHIQGAVSQSRSLLDELKRVARVTEIGVTTSVKNKNDEDLSAH